MFAALYCSDVATAPVLAACAQAFSPRVEVQLEGRLVLIDVAGLGRVVGDAEAIAAELRSAIATCDVRRATGATCLDVPRATCDVARSTFGAKSDVPRRTFSTPHVAPRTSHVAIVVAPSRIAALLLAVAGSDAVVLPGRTATAVGALNLSVFHTLANLRNQPRSRLCALCSLAGAPHCCGRPGGACTELTTLRRWGLSTLGDVAALPSAELSARLGQMGVLLQRLARGLDTQPLVPVIEETRFEASLDLEWPIDELQPLSFVLARLLEPLSAALERADRGAAAIVTELTLVRLAADATRTYVRRLELPAPMRDARVLRTLILLDLESHPPSAGIDRVVLRIEPTPGRIVQFSLLERAGPQPETVATLVSRLTALMGEGRVGSPVLLNSHAPDAFALESFRGERPEAGGQPQDEDSKCLRPVRPALSAIEGRGAGGEFRAGSEGPPSTSSWGPASLEECNQPTCLRRFRMPVAARVVMTGDRPVRVTTDRVGIKGGDVQQCAGPWRSSGNWWSTRGGGAWAEQTPRGEAPRAPENPNPAWDRDEYDVALSDGAAYRIYRDRHEDRWFIEGILD